MFFHVYCIVFGVFWEGFVSCWYLLYIDWFVGLWGRLLPILYSRYFDFILIEVILIEVILILY